MRFHPYSSVQKALATHLSTSPPPSTHRAAPTCTSAKSEVLGIPEQTLLQRIAVLHV